MEKNLKKHIDSKETLIEPTETRYRIEKVSFYKEFLEKYRYKELEEAFLTTNDDMTQLKKFVLKLDDVEYSPENRLCYYDEIKKCVTAFINYWEDAMDIVVRDVEKYRGSQDAMLDLIHFNISRAHSAQIEFGYGYLPVTSVRERDVYDDLEEKYRVYIGLLHHIKERTEFRCLKRETEEFIDLLIQQTLEKTHEMYKFTRDYIGQKLIANIDKITTNLDNLIIHVRNNHHQLQGERHDIVTRLLTDLYEGHKRQIRLARRPNGHVSHGFAELQKTIEAITRKLDASPTEARALNLLEEALVYWMKKRREIGHFNVILSKLKTEAMNCEQQEEIYNSKVCMELPGSKRKIWEEIGQNIQKQKLYVRSQEMEVARALVTHFGLIGYNYEVYNDYIGQFLKDQYDYRIYNFDRGLQEYYVNCDGNLEKVPPPEDKIYRDSFGRYVPDDRDPASYPQPTLDETSFKLYRRKEYASAYKLSTNETFVKVTEDCGHSNSAAFCGMHAKDPNDFMILPSSPPLPILKKELETEAVEYIWANFGGVVPEVLVEVFLAKPNNPIHYLAHCLVQQINKRLRSENDLLKEKIVKYREDILKERRDKLIKAYQEYQAKQVKRRKPEESDDSYNWMVYYQQQAAAEFITQINETNWN